MKKVKCIFVALLSGVCAPLSGQTYTFFEEDFESIPAASPIDNSVEPPLEPERLQNGIIVGANVFDARNNYKYGYFGFKAPNIAGDGAHFSNVPTGEGGPDQGTKVLAVFSDYNNTAAQQGGDLVDANTYVEFFLEEADLGTTVTFQYDAKLGNLDQAPLSAGFVPEAEVFLKVLNPSTGYSVVVADLRDASTFPTTWGTYTLTITIPNDQAWIGRLLQAGFRVKTSEYRDSTTFYDNLLLTSDRVEPEPGRIEVVKYGREEGVFSVTFESVDTRNYELQRRVPGGDWEPVDSIFDAFAPEETLFDNAADATQPTALYRVIEIAE